MTDRQKTRRELEDELTARHDLPLGGLRAIQLANGYDRDAQPAPRVRSTGQPPARGRRRRTLTDELDELERTDPAVSAAADNLDAAVEWLTDRLYPNLAATVERALRQEQRRAGRDVTR